MTITNDQLKSIAAAVLLQTAKDYESHPEWRKSIEDWITQGSVWLDIALPDYTEHDIIGRLRENAKTKDKQSTAKEYKRV